MSERPNEQLALAGVFPPSNIASTPGTTGAVDMSAFQQALVVFLAGAIDKDITLSVEEAEDDQAASFAAMTPVKSVTITAAAGDNTQQLINVRADELSLGKRTIRATATAVAGGSTSLVSIAVLGVEARYGPASDANVATAKVATV